MGVFAKEVCFDSFPAFCFPMEMLCFYMNSVLSLQASRPKNCLLSFQKWTVVMHYARAKHSFHSHFKYTHTHEKQHHSLSPLNSLKWLTCFWQTSLIHFNQHLCVYRNVCDDTERCELAIFVHAAVSLTAPSFYELTLIVIMWKT